MPVPALFLLALTYLGFVSLGLPDSITGVVWPSVHRHFGIPHGHLGMLLTATGSGYLVSTMLAGRLLQAVGVGGLLAGSCALVAVSLTGYALAPSWAWFVGSGVIAGLGAGAIDTGLNAYAARHFSARQMNWLHACWGVGASLGAMLTTAILSAGLAWQWTYGSLAVVMAALTLTFMLSMRAWRDGGVRQVEPATGDAVPPATFGQAVSHPVVWAQIGAFFIYTGVEMTAAQWAFTLLTQYRDLSGPVAGLIVTCYWSSLTAGRFGFGIVADRLGPRRLLGGAITAAMLGGLTFVLAPSSVMASAGLIMLGASLAPIYPGMMSQTPARLGRLADMAVGFQVGAAMLGSVFFPTLGGLLLQAYGHTWLNGMLGVLVLGLWLAIAGLFRNPSP
jgi:fucose permease